MEHRWLFMPDDFVARPGVEPPRTRLDSSRSQRFVMLDSVFTLAGGTDWFRGFGTGATEPCPSGRRDEVLAYAVGTIVDGVGRFRGCDGTYTYCGALSPRGFRGSLVLRVMDHEGLFHAEALGPMTESFGTPEPDVTYLFLRGQKEGRKSRTEYIFGRGNDIVGLDVEQQIRLVDLDCAEAGESAVRCSLGMGPVIGRMTAKIGFNLLNPGAPGTAVAPIPFSSYNTYTVFSADGRLLGSFEANGAEGRTFTMELRGAPGQRALRFGGFGPILNGQGRFAGIKGQMTDNSVVGIAPHALATSYVLRIFDPDGRFRAQRDGRR
jgi:hypothetical protein